MDLEGSKRLQKFVIYSCDGGFVSTMSSKGLVSRFAKPIMHTINPIELQK